ncbi:MAG: carbon storage regulator CsrA [Planctomycetota bacterium]
MLVLTRKTDEQILIGDDIKITLIRVKGNQVRIGIDAPREIRVVRGELAARDAIETSEATASEADTIDPESMVFANPPATTPKLVNRIRDVAIPTTNSAEPKVFSARVTLPSSDRLDRGAAAPLTRFMSAT